MTKTFLYLSLFLTNFCFSQTPAVTSLKKNSDKIERKLSPTPTLNKRKQPVPIIVDQKISYVNPFIGTGGHGHTYPGASVPFGMMQLSPDTRHEGWDGCSGYHYSDSIIYGFSHTHLSGTGVPDYCDLLVVPQSGKKAKTAPGYSSTDGYGSTFTHKNEKASPGYYAVNLTSSKINVRLVSTAHSGIHEYTFLNKHAKKYVLIDLNHRDELIDCAVTEANNNTVYGYRTSKAWANEQHFYFHLETNIDYKSVTYVVDNGQRKLLLEFPRKTKVLLLKVGISAVDVEGAEKNLETEIPNWDFNGTKKIAEGLWTNELNRIDFYTKDRDVMVNFYTGLYHSFLNPNIFSDVDGRYRGRDNLVHQLPITKKQYTVFSLWDTYRATHPLFTLVQQNRTNAFIQTFLRQYQEGGDLPVWELAGNETECMIGYHSVSVIADAFVKNIRDYDAANALKAMIATSNFDELGKKSFGTRGFISLADEPESVSKGLEYAYDDYCIARMASAMQVLNSKIRPDNTNLLHYNSIAEEYFKRSFNFINYFDPSTKFMRARRDGLWYAPFHPSEVNFNYTEANSYQYSLYAPQAVGTLTDLLGGKDALEEWLDRLFAAKSELEGRHQVDITGLIGQYAHGNEPSHHMAYLYNYTNHPNKTQFYIDKILNEQYSNAPDGLSGNEDCGQMSSWYVLSAMGIYQIAPANPYYEIGRPLMDEATVHLENYNTFSIKVINNSKENKYIQSIQLNNQQLNRLYLHHDEIMHGGELIIVMGAKQNPKVDQYSSAKTMLSPSETFIPLPHFEQEERTFLNHMKVTINYPKIKNRTFEIKYTLDGSIPTLNSKTFNDPITVNESTVITTALVSISKDSIASLGQSISNEFVKRNENQKIKLESQFANQYAAGGNEALIDGIRGGNEYRTGDWQGFFDTDLVAEIIFENAKELKEIGLSTLQDRKSWIFYPKNVTFEVSFDGLTFHNLETINSPISEDKEDKSTYTYKTSKTIDQPVKVIRVKAKTYGVCPTWHLGAGNPTWLFADEILFK